jgi:general stress protein 26
MWPGCAGSKSFSLFIVRKGNLFQTPFRARAFVWQSNYKGRAMTKPATEADLQKVSGLIKEIRVAMLTSEDGGHLRSRPMVAAQKDFTGELYFFTRAGAAKTGEVQHNHQVNVSYADAGHQNYVSLSGTADILHDRNLIEAHWSEGMRTWFPKGKTDPEIAILKVTVVQAEYWDAPSSTMVYLYGYAKAAITGTPPHPGGNEKLAIR